MVTREQAKVIGKEMSKVPRFLDVFRRVGKKIYRVHE